MSILIKGMEIPKNCLECMFRISYWKRALTPSGEIFTYGCMLNGKEINTLEKRCKDCPIDVRADVIWKLLKDADALDRSRFARGGCDKSYLRLGIYNTETGQNILDLASYLPSWTQSLEWDEPYQELVQQIYKYCE